MNLADALVSVRQLANSTGDVVLARAYDPYGNLVENNAYDGVTTAYGYTGEYTDVNGMVYLRARYYSPAQGRFVSKDVWEGDYNNPLSLNRWGYVEGNPINYIDPSGLSSIHYTYDREHAASYAMDKDHISGLDSVYDFSNTFSGDLSDECTLFASSVLYEGKVKDWRDDPYKMGRTSDYPDIPYWDIEILKKEGWNYDYEGITWFRTPPFYDFATKIIGGYVYSYNNPPQYNNELVYGISRGIDNNWENFLSAMRPIIKKGDLVFYGNGGNNWYHVAVVVGWGPPTSWGTEPIEDLGPFVLIGNKYMAIDNLQNKCLDPLAELPSRPLVVERSGKIKYADSRSLDNTAESVHTINIAHIDDNH